MRVCCYFPNKPLRYGSPSGDRTISEHLLEAIARRGHFWIEVSSFRSRLFWQDLGKIAAFPYEAARAVCRFIEFRPDVWLTYHSYYKSPDVFGWWIRELGGVEKVKYVIFQGMYGTGPRKKAAFKAGYLINLMALKRADLVFSNNLMDLPGLIRVVPRDRLFYLPPGIFPEEFNFDDGARSEVRSRHGIKGEDRVILTVSRFRPGVKFESLGFLFESLKFVKEPFKLIVVGAGPMEKEVLKLAGELERANGMAKVIFVGQIARGELWRYYSSADLFAFPGIGESLGMVYLEAQACRLPVVALRSPGVEQVVKDGLTAILLDDRNPEKYALAVESLLGDSDLRYSMSMAARDFVVSERNAHINYAEFVEILERLVRNGLS